jgi:uncharacterized DUF497 family protein
MALYFEWDERKARSNLAKHGVSFADASTVFGDARSLTIPDPAHSQVEERAIVLGQSHQRKLLVVVHTERGDHVRIISARPASRHERKIYEEAH